MLTKIKTANSVSNFLVLYRVLQLKHDMSFMTATPNKISETIRKFPCNVMRLLCQQDTPYASYNNLQ
jgi:hypothetical protein